MSEHQLHDEVYVWLEAHGPATSTEIAMGLCRRRVDVDAVLASDAFAVAPRLAGRAHHARLFDLSQRVPGARRRLSWPDVMLRVLSDGRRHSRSEIIAAAGRPVLTNNAAAKLRKRGIDVRCERVNGTYRYWLGASLEEPGRTPARSGSSSDDGSGAAA